MEILSYCETNVKLEMLKQLELFEFFEKCGFISNQKNAIYLKIEKLKKQNKLGQVSAPGRLTSHNYSALLTNCPVYHKPLSTAR